MKIHVRVLLVAGLFVGICGLSTIGAAGAAGWGLAPEVGCTLLADRRLAARGDYRQNGDVHQCRSRRRNITGSNDVPHDIRFVAQGDADLVRRFRLELRVNSRSGVQRALGRFADDAELLTQQGIGEALPAVVREAIMGATDGEWPVGDRTLTLKRITTGAGLFELRFSIR